MCIYTYIYIYIYIYVYVYKSKAILANDADSATLLPKFGEIERISQVLGFFYFEITKYNAEVFSK